MKRHVELKTLEPPVVEEIPVERNALQNEIECPRCQDFMVLCAGFDYLYYSCNDCGFVLSYLKK